MSKKRTVFVVITPEGLARSEEEWASLDLRLPGEVLAVRETAQGAFEVTNDLRPRYGKLHVKVIQATEAQLDEFIRREAGILKARDSAIDALRVYLQKEEPLLFAAEPRASSYRKE